MKVLIDADFLLEALINRENLIEDAEKLWNLLENQEIQGLITDIGLKKICIFVKKLGGLEAVEQITSIIESMVKVQTVDRDIIEEARSFDLLDFESAVEIVCAYAWDVGAIVTQNIKNFSQAEVPIVSISQLLERKTLERLLILSVPIKIPIPLLTLSLLRGTEIFTLSLLWVMIRPKLEDYNKTTNNTLLKVVSGVGISSVLFVVVVLANSPNYQPTFPYYSTRQDMLEPSYFYDGFMGLREKYNSLINNYHDHTRQDILISSDFYFDPVVELKRLNYKEFNHGTAASGGFFSLHTGFNDYDENSMYIANFDRDSISSDLYMLEDKDLFGDYIIAFGSPDVGISAGADLISGMDFTGSSDAVISYTLTTSVILKAPQPSNLIGLGFMADISNVMDFTVSSGAVSSYSFQMSVIEKISEPSGISNLAFMSVLALGSWYKKRKIT